MAFNVSPKSREDRQCREVCPRAGGGGNPECAGFKQAALTRSYFAELTNQDVAAGAERLLELPHGFLNGFLIIG